YLILLLYASHPHRHLHSFPTRRSSDLPQRRQLLIGTRQVALTAKEFDLLEELMRARGNVLTREILMNKVWGYHTEATSRTLDTRSEEHTSELQSPYDLVCRLLLEKKNK